MIEDERDTYYCPRCYSVVTGEEWLSRRHVCRAPYARARARAFRAGPSSSSLISSTLSGFGSPQGGPAVPVRSAAAAAEGEAMSKPSRTLAAYHEAGHVVMALAMENFPVTASFVEKCTECPAEDDCWIGTTQYGSDEFLAIPDDGPEGIARYIILCASGVVSEDFANGAPVEGSGGLSDEVAASQAAFVLAFATSRPLAVRVMESAPDRAREILTSPKVWPVIEAFAAAIENDGRLDSDAIRAIAARHESEIDEARDALYAATRTPLLGR